MNNKYKVTDCGTIVCLVNDTEHDSFIDYYNYKFNFCGCGTPENTILHIFKFLKVVEAWKGDIDYKEYFDILNSLTGNDESSYFMLYMLDKIGLTEHGSSINCCWLSEIGREFVENIEREIKEKKMYE